jgi:TetR/AcrR family transcriptional repressor of nem operon
MRRSREVKAETHSAIVAKASRLFRERGVEGTSVADVMAEAGLTHGGFYRHFEDKDALVAATIRAIFDGITESVEERAATVGADKAVEDYFAYYLSDEHLANPGFGCPAPTLGSEIARAPEALKAEFGASLNRSLAVFAKGLPGDETARRELATRELAMRIGAMVIARASDAATARAVLAACRKSGAPMRGESGES